MTLRPLFTRNRLSAALLGASLLTFGTTALAKTATVSNTNDFGEGSLREALASGATDVVVTAAGDIGIDSTLVYSGDREIRIFGTGQTVKASGDFTLLEIANGANLTVVGLNFEGIGGFDIHNQSTAGSAAGKGIFVDVQDDQRGMVKLVLQDVTVSNVANHGIHVSDCDLADACGGGATGDGGGSDASISVSLTNVTVSAVGLGKFDADGVRVDERDKGSIIFSARGSLFEGVGADGVELDEGQDGNVTATVVDSTFKNNGSYCDPAVLKPQLEDFLGEFDDEEEFDEEEAVIEADIPGPVTGSLDDGCFEYEVDFYDSGFVEAFEYAIDTDDGFDIDEEGNGVLRARLVSSKVNGNLDEGVDFDEADRGSIEVVIIDTVAFDNTDDGFKFSEEGLSGIEAVVHRSIAADNGGKGFVFEEEDNGSVNVLVSLVKTENNDDSDDTGLEVVQDDKGKGTLTVESSMILDGIDADGVEVIEN
jgi:hypothetical protein